MSKYNIEDSLEYRDSQENIDACLSCKKEKCYGTCKRVTRHYRRINPKEAMELFEQGLSDREIAYKIGVTPTSVREWRKRNGLERK